MSAATKKDLNGQKIRVRQIRSLIGRDQRARGTLRALGLGNIGDSCEHTATPTVLGMIRRVRSVIEVKEQA